MQYYGNFTNTSKLVVNVIDSDHSDYRSELTLNIIDSDHCNSY